MTPGIDTGGGGFSGSSSSAADAQAANHVGGLTMGGASKDVPWGLILVGAALLLLIARKG